MLSRRVACAPKPPNLLRIVQNRAADYIEACNAAAPAAAAQALIVKLSGASASCYVSLWNKLLKLYCQCGLHCHAHQLFDKMPHRDVYSYNTVISSLTHMQTDAADALRFYARMLCDEGVRPDRITFSALLAVSTAQVEQIHCHTVKFGACSDASVGGGLVKGYERYRGLDEAIRAFKDIDVLDSVSWNIMIDACARRGHKQHAVEIFSRMQKQYGGRFDLFTVTSLLKTCKESEDFGLGRQIHGCSLKAGLVSQTPVGNAIVTMYLKCGGTAKDAVKVFRGILDPNVISWTAIITGFVHNGLAEETVAFYKEMLCIGMMENEFCFASVLGAFSLLANILRGRMIHSRIIKLEFCSDVTVGSALIDMYFKCGSLEDAQLAFQTMESRDAVTWSIMILGLGQHGKGKESLEIFREMEGSGTSPDAVVFLAGLSACCYCGMVEEGMRIFCSMVKDYAIIPTKRHCACIVDLLGRAGRLSEAEKFIRDLGVEMNSESWEALLGACQIHGVVKLGERSAEKVMELEPYKHVPYVSLSNIYAEKQLWSDKEKLRTKFDISGLMKEAACSRLGLNI